MCLTKKHFQLGINPNKHTIIRFQSSSSPDERFKNRTCSNCMLVGLINNLDVLCKDAHPHVETIYYSLILEKPVHTKDYIE